MFQKPRAQPSFWAPLTSLTLPVSSGPVVISQGHHIRGSPIPALGCDEWRPRVHKREGLHGAAELRTTLLSTVGCYEEFA